MSTEQQRKELTDQIKSNQHEVFVVSIQEMDAIVKSSPKGNLPSVRSAWQKIKSNVEVGANYYASADDLRTLGKLVGDLGGFTTKAYIKSYGGKPHIILKGHPGLRRMLTGVKYGISNPKVITMGLGKAGAIHAAKSGGIFSVVLLSAYRVADYFLTDGATLSQLIGSLATDVVKVGIATGASIAVASAVGAAFTVAIGPLVAVIFVGITVSMALTAVDDHYGITERVVAALDEIGEDARLYYEQAASTLKQEARKSLNSIIDYAVESTQKIIIDMARHHLGKFISRRPQVF